MNFRRALVLLPFISVSCFAFTFILLMWSLMPPPAEAEILFYPAESYYTNRFPSSVAIGDLNKDTIPDLAVTNGGDYTGLGSCVSILLGNGDGGFQTAVNYSAGNGAESIAIGDFDSDSELDLAVANRRSNSCSILLGNGDGSFKNPVNYDVGQAPYSVAIGDLNEDGNMDLVVTYIYGVNILLGNGDGSFQNPVKYDAGQLPLSVAIGDLNADDDLDIAVGNASSRNVSILIGNGDGSFQNPVYYDLIYEVESVAIGDLNKDTIPDLAVGSFYNISTLFGNGDGSFQSPANYGPYLGPYSVAIGDLDGDTNADIAAVLDWDESVSILLGNGDGSFKNPVNFKVGEEPRFVAIGDLDGDNSPDLATANWGSDNVSILINREWQGPILQNPGNGHWYQRCENSMTWHNAKAHCESMGGYLATITSQAEYDFVYEKLGVDAPYEMIWLGATDEMQEGVWRWVTDEPWDFNHWEDGQPDNCGGIEHYLTFFTLNAPPVRIGFWNDLGSGNSGGCGCNGCINSWFPMSTICEWNNLSKVTLDIKPGSYPNSINLKSKGKVPVAILTTADFDAYEVDPVSCVLAGACPLRWNMEDVDHDGDHDMLLHFMTQELDLTKESTEATMECETFEGMVITGTDSVNIVPEAKVYTERVKKK